MDFSQTLQHWYAHHGRTLPWRGINDPYRIWLSEIILQQTRVEQGFDYYNRFTQLFPTVSALAAASEQEVLTAWQGLGYYSRARNLHKAAHIIHQNGAFPDTYESLLALPGVGDYTASAIASFAYGLPCAVVDGNVYRVLSRHFGLTTPIDTTPGKHEYKALAEELLDRKHSSEHNQALMDFGAMVCTPRAPKCLDCPLHDSCAVIANGLDPEEYPKKSRKTIVKERHFAYVFVECPKGQLMHKRQAGDIWQGLHEPLLFESTKTLGANEVFELTCKALGISSAAGTFRQTASAIRHQLTHRLIIADAYTLSLDETPAQLPADCTWVKPSEINLYPVPRLIQLLQEKANSI